MRVVLHSDGSFGWVLEMPDGVALAGIAASPEQAVHDAVRELRRWQS